MNLTITRMGMILVAVPLLFQFALFRLTDRVQTRVHREAELALHSNEVLRTAQVLLTRLVEAQSGNRGLVLTDDAVFASFYHRASTDVPRLLDKLQALVADHTEQSARIERIATQARGMLDYHRGNIEAWQAGRREEYLARMKNRDGKNQMDRLRDEIEAFLQVESELEQQRSANLERIQQTTHQFLLAGTVLFVIIMLALGGLFHRVIARRLSALADNLVRFGAGEALQPTQHADDEIGHIDQALHTMAQQLTAANAELRDAAERTRLLYDAAPCGYHSLDPNGVFLSANETELNWFGYRREELIGQRKFSDLLTPTSRALFEVEFARFKQAGSASNLEFEIVRRDGSILPILLSATAVYDQHGQLAFTRTNIVDITQRKETERQVQVLNAELERRVIERTAELREANRDLAEKSRENETFVYSVSHDLRSPLVNLQGFGKELDLVRDDLRQLLDDERIPADIRKRVLGLLDEEMAESIRFILSGVMRLSSIIDALLRLSRVGRVEYQIQSVDPNPMLQRIVASYRGTIDEHSARVELQPLPVLRGDPTALEQMFANLLGNALKYLDPARPGRIEIGAAPRTSNEPPVVYVKDNGLGIPGSAQSKIFRAFQRAHPHVASGEGMGLAIVRRIVDRHGARIWVESTEGIGSTFFVEFPRAD